MSGAKASVREVPWIVRRESNREIDLARAFAERHDSGVARAGARGRLGPAVHALVGCAVFALVLDTWCIQGLIAPVIVASGSMAPALIGPHRQWQCAACGRQFVGDLESLKAPEAPAVCPNCGAPNDARQGVDRRGDRVLVDRSAFLWRAPRRWEMVVFRSPDESSDLCVKRIVGLPGESVAIEDGDVLVDGRPAARTLDEQRAMAVNVYDTPPTGRRWRSADNSWEFSGGRAVHHRRAGNPLDETNRREPSAAVDWLTYHHELCTFVGEAPRGGPIVDESPCDQGESRTLDSVWDIMLACTMKASGSGEVYLKARSRGDDFTVRIDVVSGQGELEHNGRSVARFEAPPTPLRTARALELVLADRQVRVALDGSLLVERAYVRSNASTSSTKYTVPAAKYTAPSAKYTASSTGHTLAIGARRAGVEVRRLQVLRDIHYTPFPQASPAKHRLAPGEYFVLGDNSPHAIDSRAWATRGGVFQDQIVGRAIKW